MLKKDQGFTLIELMIALAIGMFLIMGVVGTYSAIQTSIKTSKDLENAQKIIRYSAQVFTRSLKQTAEEPEITAGNLFPMVVQQKANTTSCVGTTPIVDYYETFSFVTPTLSCSVNNKSDDSVIIADIPLLTGIDDITPTFNDKLFIVTVVPEFIPANFGGGINIDVALNSLIFKEAMPGA